MADATALLLDCFAGAGPAAYLRMVAAEYKQLGLVTEVLAVDDRVGSDGDWWALLLAKVAAADIVIVGTPTWSGVDNGVAQRVLERLARTHPGTQPLRDKVGGVVVIGDDERARQIGPAMLRELASLGCTLPPNADAYCVADEGATLTGTTRLMTRNTAHLARILTAAPFPMDAGMDAAAPATSARPKLFSALAKSLPADVDQGAVDAERLAANADRLVDRRRTLDLTRREKGLPEKRKLPRPPLAPDPDGLGPPL